MASLASLASWRFSVLGLAAILAVPARGAEAPAGGSLQQNQMMRQQQQDTLQLRMLQQQRSLQSPTGSTRERQELERLEINQKQRQQDLQYRQSIEPPAAHAGDDAGVQRAKDELDRRNAEGQGKAQLQRFDYELRQRTESRRTEDARGEIRSPEPPAPLE